MMIDDELRRRLLRDYLGQFAAILVMVDFVAYICWPLLTLAFEKDALVLNAGSRTGP
ncbi:hypothetical protein [Massilia consociata]|uniref:RDD family protein n=1 Tax=Massilia consociata TaxID=760117 RepID=A0ABV6FHA0_9BURK